MILEIGCNIGYFTKELLKTGSRIIGLDVNKEYIKIAHRKLGRERNGDFIIADAEHMPFRDNAFDFIICEEVIEHLKHPLSMLREIYRLLKLKGWLILSTVNKAGLWCLLMDKLYVALQNFWRKVGGRERIMSDHISLFTYRELTATLARYGFKINEIGIREGLGITVLLELLLKRLKIRYLKGMMHALFTFEVEHCNKLPKQLHVGWIIEAVKST